MPKRVPLGLKIKGILEKGIIYIPQNFQTQKSDMARERWASSPTRPGGLGTLTSGRSRDSLGPVGLGSFLAPTRVRIPPNPNLKV